MWVVQEEYTYQDAVTNFLVCLFVDFDFEGAQRQLVECQTVLDNDFFLTALRVIAWQLPSHNSLRGSSLDVHWPLEVLYGRGALNPSLRNGFAYCWLHPGARRLAGVHASGSICPPVAVVAVAVVCTAHADRRNVDVACHWSYSPSFVCAAPAVGYTANTRTMVRWWLLVFSAMCPG